MKLPEDIKSAVETYVQRNLEKDWFELDLPRIEKCRDNDDFLIAMRPEGVDTLFISGPCKKYSNWEWFNSAISQGRSNEQYLYYDGKFRKFRKLSRVRAIHEEILNAYVRDFAKHAAGETQRTFRNFRVVVLAPRLQSVLVQLLPGITGFSLHVKCSKSAASGFVEYRRILIPPVRRRGTLMLTK